MTRAKLAHEVNRKNDKNQSGVLFPVIGIARQSPEFWGIISGALRPLKP
jgi:hypothetical protein